MCEFSIALETQHTAKVRCKLHARIKGIESLEAVKKLCAGDPARLGDIVRRIL